MTSISIVPVRGVPMVQAGDDLAALLQGAIAASNLALEDGDILAVAQKIVSKAEGRLIRLGRRDAYEAATELAEKVEKDPRLVQLILDESTEVVRHKPGVLIVRHRLGLVGAHAGIDQSNIDHGEGEDEGAALLLPEDPDASAARLRDAMRAASGVNVGVLITDSANRPWRLGTIGVAIGAAGFNVLDDRRGGSDIFGRELKVTLINRADSIATAATLAMGETDERTPAAIVRGFPIERYAGQVAADINRPLDEDLFR